MSTMSSVLNGLQIIAKVNALRRCTEKSCLEIEDMLEDNYGDVEEMKARLEIMLTHYETLKTEEQLYEPLLNPDDFEYDIEKRHQLLLRIRLVQLKVDRAILSHMQKDHPVHTLDIANQAFHGSWVASSQPPLVVAEVQSTQPVDKEPGEEFIQT